MWIFSVCFQLQPSLCGASLWAVGSSPSSHRQDRTLFAVLASNFGTEAGFFFGGDGHSVFGQVGHSGQSLGLFVLGSSSLGFTGESGSSSSSLPPFDGVFVGVSDGESGSSSSSLPSLDGVFVGVFDGESGSSSSSRSSADGCLGFRGFCVPGSRGGVVFSSQPDWQPWFLSQCPWEVPQNLWKN